MSAKDILASWYADKDVLVFGHRGASAYAPMNTIPAFELAVQQGADAIELDVHLTTDGEVVIVHDFTIDKTTNSTGNVTEKTLAELKSLDAGSWFGGSFAGTKIPTLDEVFEAVGDRLYINIEIKTESLESDGTEEAVIRCIRKHNMSERVIVSTFKEYVLARFRALAPEIPIALLIEPPDTIEFARHVYQNSVAFDAFHPSHKMLTPEFIAFANEHELIVNCWTVNSADIARNLKAQGVRGVMSDYPDKMLEALS